MKKRTAAHPYYSSRSIRRYAYPNAAEPEYFAEKLLDGITAAVSCMGTVTLLIYILTI